MTLGCEPAAFIQAAAQGALAFPLALAGASKLRDQSSARRLWEASGFGVPVPWRVLPALELAVAAALLLGSAASWLAAAALLVVTTAALQRALARGYAGDCGCLGAVDAGRVGSLNRPGFDGHSAALIHATGIAGC